MVTPNISQKKGGISVPKENEKIGSLLDLVHLTRQTMGDNQLENEILALFLVQCENCHHSLSEHHEPGELTEIAHQMKGCASSVRAWRVAQKAALLEKNPTQQHLVSHLRDQIHLVASYLKSMVDGHEIDANSH